MSFSLWYHKSRSEHIYVDNISPMTNDWNTVQWTQDFNIFDEIRNMIFVNLLFYLPLSECIKKSFDLKMYKCIPICVGAKQYVACKRMYGN